MKASLSPLRHARFRYFLGARFASLLGSALAPLAVAFAVLDLTHSASALGIVLAARTIPNVVLMLFGGVVADRFRRDRVLVYSNVICFGTQALVAGMLLSGTAEVWQIAVIEAINGAAAAFTFPALMGIMPQIVDREELQQANSLNGLVRNVTTIGGGAAAGAIVGFWGAGWALAIDSVSFAIAAVLISRLKLAALPKPEASTNSTWHDLRVGWREFTSRRWVWVIVLAFTFMNAIQAGAVQTLGPVIADETFGRVGWGFLSSAMGIGLVVGALLMLRWQPRRPMLVGMIGVGLEAPVLLALGIDPVLPVLLTAFFLMGIGSDLFGIGWETALQEHIPQDKLSRVFSYDALGSFVAIPIGQLSAGPLAAVFGADKVIAAGGVLVAVIVLLTLLDPSVRNLRHAPANAPEPVGM